MSELIPTQIPMSTLFILGIAVVVSFLTSLVNRLMTDPEKTKAARREVSEWNSELRKAQRGGDKKTMEKLLRKQQDILRLQSQMMWQSMKVMLLFFVPLLIMWQVLGSIFKNAIAYFPGVGPTISLLFINLSSLVWWYLLCSFLFSTIFSHVFGLVSIE